MPIPPQQESQGPSVVKDVTTVADGATESLKSVADIQAWLATHLAQSLELEPQQIDVHKDFTDYGLNSIEVVDISGELEQVLGRRLDPTLVFEYPNIQALSAYLAEDMAQQTIAGEQATPVSEAGQLLEQLDEMSDTEVDQLLGSMLAEDQKDHG